MSGAQTLRDYWSGHGHSGPSHGAERDAIAWGTPGDFMRCVAQVSEHMTEEQAKGYCNERHHDALGVWPSQHAAAERGKSMPTITVDQAFLEVRVALALAKFAGSDEARVPAGSLTGGQFTVGGDGPSKAPKKPNPYANGQKKPEPDAHQKHEQHLQHLADKTSTAQIHAQLSAAEKNLANLEATKKKLSTTGVSSFGTSSTVKPAASSSTSSTASTSSTTASTSSTASTTAASSGSSKPAATTAAKPSSNAAAIAQINTQIAAAKQKISDLKQELADQAKKGTDPDLTKQRYKHGWVKIDEVNTHLDNAHEAIKDGRYADAVNHLGAAHAAAKDPKTAGQISDTRSDLLRRVYGMGAPAKPKKKPVKKLAA